MNARPSLTALLGAAALISLLSACSKPDPHAPLRADFETGLRSFLADGHDRLCLGMFDWPIDLSEAEAGAKSRHAVQLPVFEQLGLAKSTIIAVPRSAENPDGAIKRYALTDEGRKYFMPHAYQSRDGVQHPNDFCAARISVARVVGWQLDAHDAQHPTALVRYSYHVEPAPWMNNAEAQRVLPMVARVIQGAEGGIEMHQGFVKNDKGWVAVAGAV